MDAFLDDNIGSTLLIGVVVSLIIFVLVIVVVIFFILKKKPELVDRLKRKRGGDEERVKREAGKDLNDEEQLIKTGDATNEVKAEKQAGNCESVCKPNSQDTPNNVHKDGPRDNKSGLNSSAASTKFTPETEDSASKESPV